MAGSSSEVENFLQVLLSEIKTPLNLPADWQTVWQITCEEVWTSSATSHTSPRTLELFTRAIQDQRYFALARLIIPELRESCKPSSAMPQRQMILDSIEELRSKTQTNEGLQQSDFDDISYDLEKRKLFDAEMHRARVFLHYSGALDANAQHQFKMWIAGRPGAQE